MMLGRRGKTWGDTNESMTKNFKHPQDADTWTTRVSRAMLVLTLNLWATRNKQTHGNKNGTSFVDKDEAVQKIQIYYKVVQPLVLAQDQWLFHQSVRRKLKENYLTQLAWIDAVERVCNDIITATGFTKLFPHLKIFTL